MKTSAILENLFKQIGKDAHDLSARVEGELKTLSEQTGKELKAFTKEALTDLGGGLRRLADALDSAAKEAESTATKEAESQKSESAVSG